MDERKGHHLCLDITMNELGLSMGVTVRPRECLWQAAALAAQKACGTAGHLSTLAGAVG